MPIYGYNKHDYMTTLILEWLYMYMVNMTTWILEWLHVYGEHDYMDIVGVVVRSICKRMEMY